MAARHKSDGALDTTFGGTGKLPQVFVPNAANITPSLALLSSGKFLLAGTCFDLGDNDFCVLRFNVDGSVDSTFGVSGSVITPIGSADDRPRAMLVQPDGKIAVAGTCNNGVDSDFCAARYLANGTLDTSFGTSGTRATSFGTGNDYVTAMTLQGDGKLLLAGHCGVSSGFDFCALRYTALGARDATFATGGKLSTRHQHRCNTRNQ